MLCISRINKTAFAQTSGRSKSDHLGVRRPLGNGFNICPQAASQAAPGKPQAAWLFMREHAQNADKFELCLTCTKYEPQSACATRVCLPLHYYATDGLSCLQ